jgi:hypothetical protein
MKCENLQFNLSIYSDGYLTEDERGLIDAHLAQCHLCRQKSDDLLKLKNDFRAMARPEIPNYVLNSVRNAVELRIAQRQYSIFGSQNFHRWLELRLMPYGVGVVASLLTAFLLLGTLLSGIQQPIETAKLDPAFPSAVMLSNSKKLPGFEWNEVALNPRDFAQSRISVSGESPSVNPAGALIALTRSLVRGEMKDEEVVVVADVFSNGLAQIAEVVEPPGDTQLLRDLDKALADPAYAPFVPASFDKRADSVQIVLKIQRVDVNVGKSKSNRKK